MATIHTVELNINPNRPDDRATIVVTCEVEFTEFEVNTMTMLGLRYKLQCQLLDMDMVYAPTVAAFANQHFPRVASPANRHEHVVFETDAPMHDLHVYVFGKDTLLAEVTLTNEETGADVVTRSKALAVDLRT